MKIDLKDYLKYKGDILKAYEKGQIKQVVLYCVCNHIPLIPAYSFISELYPEPEILESIERLKTFYRISEVIK